MSTAMRLAVVLVCTMFLDISGGGGSCPRATQWIFPEPSFVTPTIGSLSLGRDQVQIRK